jgi:hypothetical protein
VDPRLEILNPVSLTQDRWSLAHPAISRQKPDGATAEGGHPPSSVTPSKIDELPVGRDVMEG